MITFQTMTITIIFRDGNTAIFSQAIKWQEKEEKLEIFFVVDDNLMYYNYPIDDVATIVKGEIEQLAIN